MSSHLKVNQKINNLYCWAKLNIAQTDWVCIHVLYICLSSVLLWITLQLTEQQQREVWVTCGFNYWDSKRVDTASTYTQPRYDMQPLLWCLTYAANISPSTLQSHQMVLKICWIIRTQSTHSFENVFNTKLVEIKYACFEGLCEDSRGQTGVCKSSSLRPPSPSLHTITCSVYYKPVYITYM